MANRIRTIDFLPEIFRTETNRQFLGSTLDQLVQNPKLKPTQGYIGRRIGPGVDPSDNYVIEPTNERTDYQLEPGVVFLETNTNTVNDAVTYPGFLDTIKMKGGLTNRQDRLFNSEYYSWDPFVDFDKLINFSQYYWLSEGPDDVTVSASDVPLTEDYQIERTADGYTFSGEAGTLPTITLVRQGSYTFDVNQVGSNFWIQLTPGTSGVLPQAPNQSSREVLGVVNNGEDQGTVTFNVPDKTAQNFYFELNDAGNVDFATNLKFNQINNIFLSEFLSQHGGIDGITDIDGRTIIFLNRLTGEDSGWFKTTQFDSSFSGYDEGPFDASTAITDGDEKYGKWRISLIYDENEENPYISLIPAQEISELSKVLINYGNAYSNLSFYRTAEGVFEQVPLITANTDILYYQDSNNPEFFGVIKLVDESGEQTIDINEILGKVNYTSSNGVVFTNGLKVKFQGNTVPAEYSGNSYYVEGVGSSIKLLLTNNFITPEPYTKSNTVPYDSTPFDVGGFDDTLNAPLDQDYLTINRASIDRNPWSRSNRWFHIDVINLTASYNNTDPLIDNNLRAKRPILEFNESLKLFNFGNVAIDPVDIIDFAEVDAFSNINGTIGYSIDGYDLVDGSRVIFANDRDPAVKNKVYLVKFVEFDDSSVPVIDLQPADITTPGVSKGQSVVVISGITQQGKSFTFDGSNWVVSQAKTKVNQAPLFDVFDSNGVSYGDTTSYPGTSFNGTKIFSYAVGTGVTDTVLGQPLKYLTINNVGDIVFENNLYTDSFVYVQGTVSVDKNINDGVIRQYTDANNFIKLIGWKTSASEITTRQTFNFEYTGTDLILDIPVDSSAHTPIKMFINGLFVSPTTYTYATNSKNATIITFTTAPAIGSIIEVNVVSSIASTFAFYTVADNLQNNALNADTNELTLGTIRNHYNTICQNISGFTGEINGANNTRDLGDIVVYGENIVQQSSPLIYANTFLYSSQSNNTDFIKSLQFASHEYEKYKNLILDTVAKNDWSGYTTSQILDDVFEQLNAGKNQNSPFYWADTIPCGGTFDETTYTISPITTDTFDTLYTYDFTNANYRGILVYLNNEILTADGHEYTVATDGPRIIINTDTVTLNIGDVLTIREYTTTYGSFVPSTPTKLGLAPLYRPKKYVDNTYRTPTEVIRGHDGSLTVYFNDVRDDVLLEFETRIYNNMKVADPYNPPIINQDIIPGQFRTTDYSLAEVNEILSESFLSWVGENKILYTEQQYSAADPFTWNYSTSENRLTGDTLVGNWRGIYEYLYDTDSPHTKPWEMLGFTEEPSWWQDKYGAVPYTSGNMVLWNDLAAGVVADPLGSYVLDKFKRPQLTDIIPVDSEGNLLDPFEVIVGRYDQNSFRKSWVFGDDGPVETAWKRSSSYRFALQRLFALAQPAKYFSLLIDRDLYKYNTDYNQYLYNNRFRVTPQNIEIYGNDVIKHSYLNWIIDYNKTFGINSTDLLKTRLENTDIRLCYRMAGFSDKQYLKIFTEKSSPNSLNTSLLLPDESYQLLLYKNPTISEIQWSSVVVQKTENGYAVFGYGTTKPYFEILRSIPNGNFKVYNVAGTDLRIPADFSNNVVKVPYGYEFTSVNSVVDFLISYGRFMESQGMTFDNVENNRVLDWTQMAREFVYWSQQGWATGSLININPSADILTITKANTVLEPLNANGTVDVLLNQNKQMIKSRDYVVERFENTAKLRALSNNTFSYLAGKFTAYEHLIVFDNTSIFNDLIYQPNTGSRQSRLLLNGFTTYDWNGTLDAQGFILNQDNVKEWKPNTSYSKGEIVLYKDTYWSAGELIPPSTSFDFNVWIKSDYNKISKGLLPNLATKSDLIRNYYDTTTANLERDADLLGFGLIGFRPRQYMQNLNLDDISQVNLYKQFLGIKGTSQAVEIFSQANLDKEVADYEIFENWAIQRATYGANANRSYFEIRLDQSKLLSNPSTVSINEPQQTSIADQSLLLDNLYKQSYKITSSNVLPLLSEVQPDSGLPTAGYVNFDDVDYKVFDYNELSEVIQNIDDIRVGSTVWVAKKNDYDWSVYRTNLVSFQITQARDNLNGTSTLTFASNHGLNIGQQIVVKYFNDVIDGSYEVLTTPTLKTITIAVSLPGAQTELAGAGICFVLEEVRVAQPSDIATLSFSNNILPGNQAWVDDNGTGNWSVYRKINPFGENTQVTPFSSQINARFGASVAQGFRDQGGLVGAPGYATNTGAVYTYNRSTQGNYVETGIISMDANNFVNFGDAISVGALDWGVVGAGQSWAKQGYAVAINRDANSGSYVASQLLTEAPYRLYQDSNDFSTNDFDFSSVFSTTDGTKIGVVVDDTVQEYLVDWFLPDDPADTVRFFVAPTVGDTVNIFLWDEYGYSVAISDDERWMYVGAPGGNRVYAYNKVEVQQQQKTFVGDGSTFTFQINDVIVVDNDSDEGGIGSQQLGVTVNNLPKQAITDYLYDGENIIFITPPRTGDTIKVIRLQSKNYFPTVATATFGVEDLYTITDIYSFSVYVNDVLQRPNMDYTFDSDAKTITFILGGVTGNVLINSRTHWKLVNFYQYSGTATNPRFGHDLGVTTDGRQLIVGAPHETVDGKIEAGAAIVIDRSVERFQITPAIQSSRELTLERPVLLTSNELVIGKYYVIVALGTTDWNTVAGTSAVVYAIGDIVKVVASESGTGTARLSTPITVKVNNDFLNPDTFNNNGQYTYNSTTNVVTIDSTVSLNVGDIVEIENNELALMQMVESNTPSEGAHFGWSVDQCNTNCSLYAGSPDDSTRVPQGGSAERWSNQNRLYGTIPSVTTTAGAFEIGKVYTIVSVGTTNFKAIGATSNTVGVSFTATGTGTGTGTANPALTPGSTVRINNYDVSVSSPTAWFDSISYQSGTFVQNGLDLYRAIRAVPVGTAISNVDFWAPSNWIELFANDINTQNIPNVVATANNSILTLSIENAEASDRFIRLVVLPGLGNAYYDLGFKPLAYSQTILPPIEVAYGHFGKVVVINDEATTLLISAPDSTAAVPASYDTQTTIFDSQATEFFDLVSESGVVYTYDLLPSANASVRNPAKFAFGQQLYDTNLQIQDKFGSSISYVGGVLWIGAPQDDLGDSSGDFGQVTQINNLDRSPAWSVVYQQTPVVDVQLLNTVFTYDRLENNITRYFDFIDPLQGKILGAAKQNIDYLSPHDPASYNTGNQNVTGQTWTQLNVGEIWWDLSTVRFIDYRQDDLNYRSKRWGQLFPGSSVDVYQWIESDVPPAQYDGPGEVYSTTAYSVGSTLTNEGNFVTSYFFWVKGITSVSSEKKKTLSAQGIAQYIESPATSGIAYIAAIAPNTLALYNAKNLLSARDTILHVEFDREETTNNVHVEYDLIADGNPDSFLGTGLYRKMLDSFSGEDTLGSIVPDATLSIADQYGVQFRPRQSFFKDRFLALENYLERANEIFARFPISDSRRFDLLNSEEPEPTSVSGQWNKRVNTYAELTYQNTLTVPAGYKYLVASDETNNGLWTIYEVQVDKSLQLSRVQNYDTKSFWEYTDWISAGYNANIKPNTEVTTYSDLLRLSNVAEGTTVKVTSNSFGKFEIYQYINNEWVRVLLEDGTIRISELLWNYELGRYGFDIEVFDAQRFDQNPKIETRQILKAINEELLVDDLQIYRNELLILVFEYILTEQNAPEWLVKTSLIDVNHKIRDLLPFQIYRRDNQDFVQDYINEVKPYHVKIKEFNLRYEGIDNYLGSLSDFDVPAYFDNTYQTFISPILDNSDPPISPESSRKSTDIIWQSSPYDQWYNNYLLSLDEVSILTKGSGYTVAPQVTVVGDAVREAVLSARINSAGEVVEIEVVDAGEGYLLTPVITISGGNGTGAEAVAIMNTQLVRSFDTTIKFDRYEYISSVVDWQANTMYDEGTLVRYLTKVYSVNEVADSTALDSGDEFNPDFYTEVDQSTLSGADRTIGLYDPTPNTPGRELALLMAGIDYPGVQVTGPEFSENTGFDVGNFDINPFDNLDFGPEGLPTYSESILDVEYSSTFLDTYLGTRSTDINVEGGEFIDLYSSHAPEELVPGSVFDTLDLRVYTRPGSDWTGDGHGFDVGAKNAIYQSGGISVFFGDLVKFPVAVSVENESLGQTLDAVNNFTVDWPSKTLTITSGATPGDIIGVRTFDIGGGNQLFKQDYLGNLVGNSLNVPITFTEIFDILVKVNGFIITDYTYEANGSYVTTINFDNTYNSSHLVTIVVMGFKSPQSTWSTPQGQYFVYTNGAPEFDLTVPLIGTNPIDMLVLRNGFRLRPPESIEHFSDGSSAGPYYLPSRGSTNQGLISDNDVVVYVDNVRQTLSADFIVSPWDGSSDRYVEFTTAPVSGARIIIAVTTRADYIVNDGKLVLRNTPVPGSVITTATYNDTSEQDLLTLVFQGPSTENLTESEGFDSVGFDAGDVSGEAGSFDYSIGTIIFTNNLDIGRTIIDTERVEVHKNGERLLPGVDFTADGTIITIGGSILGPADVVTVTCYTQQIVPATLNFRIFQDMLGNQKVSRIDGNSTTLARALNKTDDIVYVVDASRLSEPNLNANIFGVVTVNGERITYREKNNSNNTLSGLRRGVAGTGIADHTIGSIITDTGLGEQIPSEYQNVVYKNTFNSDGVTKIFSATNVTVDNVDIDGAVRVKVGGTELSSTEYSVTQITPNVTVTLVSAPDAGKEVEVYVIKGKVMYAQGDTTASNGIALQEQQTQAARFIKRDI